MSSSSSPSSNPLYFHSLYLPLQPRSRDHGHDYGRHRHRNRVIDDGTFFRSHPGFGRTPRNDPSHFILGPGRSTFRRDMVDNNPAYDVDDDDDDDGDDDDVDDPDNEDQDDNFIRTPGPIRIRRTPPPHDDEDEEEHEHERDSHGGDEQEDDDGLTLWTLAFVCFALGAATVLILAMAPKLAGPAYRCLFEPNLSHWLGRGRGGGHTDHSTGAASATPRCSPILRPVEPPVGMRDESRFGPSYVSIPSDAMLENLTTSFVDASTAVQSVLDALHVAVASPLVRPGRERRHRHANAPDENDGAKAFWGGPRGGGGGYRSVSILCRGLRAKMETMERYREEEKERWKKRVRRVATWGYGDDEDDEKEEEEEHEWEEQRKASNYRMLRLRLDHICKMPDDHDDDNHTMTAAQHQAQQVVDARRTLPALRRQLSTWEDLGRHVLGFLRQELLLATLVISLDTEDAFEARGTEMYEREAEVLGGGSGGSGGRGGSAAGLVTLLPDEQRDANDVIWTAMRRSLCEKPLAGEDDGFNSDRGDRFFAGPPWSATVRNYVGDMRRLRTNVLLLAGGLVRTSNDDNIRRDTELAELVRLAEPLVAGMLLQEASYHAFAFSPFFSHDYRRSANADDKDEDATSKTSRVWTQTWTWAQKQLQGIITLGRNTSSSIIIPQDVRNLAAAAYALRAAISGIDISDPDSDGRLLGLVDGRTWDGHLQVLDDAIGTGDAVADALDLFCREMAELYEMDWTTSVESLRSSLSFGLKGDYREEEGEKKGEGPKEGEGEEEEEVVWAWTAHHVRHMRDILAKIQDPGGGGGGGE